MVLFSAITGTGLRGVVASVQAGVSITLNANLGPVPDCALGEMTSRTAILRTGARCLKRVIQSVLGRYSYDRHLPELGAKGVTSLTITAATIRGEEPAHQN